MLPKRKREDDSGQVPSKRLKMDAKALFTIEALPQELWQQILSNISLQKIQPIRQVCRQWNKLTRTMNFAKQACINRFGIDIAPLRVSNLSSLSEVSDSELVFIPTIQMHCLLTGSNTTGYGRFTLIRSFVTSNRSILQSLLNDLEFLEQKENIMGMEIEWQLDPEVSYKLVKQILSVNYPACFSEDVSEFYSFWVNLIPLFIQYKRFELVHAAEFFLDFGMSDSLIGRRVIADLLDLYDSLIQFPNFRNKILGRLTHLAPFSFYEGDENTCRRLIRLIIHLGCERENHQNKLQSILVRINYEGFEKIFGPSTSDYVLLAVIQTCEEEFDKSDDWRVKECSLLALHTVDSNAIQYNRRCLKFALRVLNNDQLHQRVHYAAILAINIYSKTDLNVFKLTKEQFSGLLKHLATALIVLHPQWLDSLMGTFSELFQLTTNSDFVTCLTDDFIEYFNDNLLKALAVQPIVFSDLSFIGRLSTLTKFLAERIKKYLPRYREELFELARVHQSCSANIIALYLQIEFMNKQNEILKQVDDGTIGFPVNIAELYSRFPLEVLAAPHTDAGKLIDSLLGIFPDSIKDLMSQATVRYKKSSDQDSLPSYIPSTGQRWNEALRMLTKTDPNEWVHLFNFKSTNATLYKKISKRKTPGWAQKRFFATDFAQSGTKALVDIASTLIRDNEKAEVLQEKAAQILNVVICISYTSLNVVDDFIRYWFRGATMLLPKIAREKLPEYLFAVLDSGRLMPSNCCTDLWDELHACINKLILTIDIPPSGLLKKIFNLIILRVNQTSNSNPLRSWWTKYLKTFIQRWPRTAWTAIQKSDFIDFLFEKRQTIGNEIVCVMTWQLFMKYFGKQFCIGFSTATWTAKHLYDRVLACLGYLGRMSCTKLLDTTKAALSRFAVLLQLYDNDENTVDLCLFNQYIVDQSKIGELLKTIKPELASVCVAGNYFLKPHLPIVILTGFLLANKAVRNIISELSQLDRIKTRLDGWCIY